MLRIRDYEDADLLPLSILYMDVRMQEFPWVDNKKCTIRDFQNDTRGETVIVADDDGYPAGFASIWVPSKFIHCLYVDPDCRRKGVATALIAEARRRWGLPLRLKCMDVNKNGKAFYEAGGWKVKSREKLDYGLCLLYSLDK